MADKMKEWQSSIVWVIGLIFICGMTYNNVRGMRDDVSENRSDIKSNTKAIHSQEILTTKVFSALTSLDKSATSQDGKIDKLNEKFDKLSEHLMMYEYERTKDGKETSKIEGKEKSKT
jgi:hypothetical protein